ncbi:MAG TPA: arginine--tRNA ligase [Cytophagaceae bacterium]|jgi:arginyl-tRNA synthetase|nr:arginine--tRNA ligase [Cytophagaceae bacterium]
MNLEGILKKGISEGLKSAFDLSVPQEDITLQPTRKEFEGTYTLVAFQFTKQTKKSPEETGKLIGEYLKANVTEVSAFNVVKGFLNISISDPTWMKIFREDIMKESFGMIPANGKKVLVEYSSPNTNKPLHLGHLRNNFLGYSVSEILRANGYNVVKLNLVNDRGIHICKSMLVYQKYGHGETPDSAAIKGDHLIGKYYVMFDKIYKEQVQQLIDSGKDKETAEKEAPILNEAQTMLLKWEEGDKEVTQLWKKMNGWVYEGFNATYKMIGVDFDKFYYESDTYLLGKTIVDEGLKKEVFFKKEDGSVWVDLTADGLDEKLLLRGDGTSVYITQDLGTADLKYNDFKSETSIYVVGNEQDYHFKVLKLILKKLGRPYADGIYHLSYGMVDLPSGRMKSREGTVVDADELVQEMIDTAQRKTTELGKVEGFNEDELKILYRVVALGALKYFLLKVDPQKRMLFNPEESIDFQGNTGPYIQFNYARISALVRKAKQINISSSPIDFVDYKDLHKSEKDLIIYLNEFTKKIEIAGKEYSPSIIAQYVYDLSKAYSHFYTELSVFNADNEATKSFRIALSDSVAKTIKRSMMLLGIEVPERM